MNRVALLYSFKLTLSVSTLLALYNLMSPGPTLYIGFGLYFITLILGFFIYLQIRTFFRLVLAIGGEDVWRRTWRGYFKLKIPLKLMMIVANRPDDCRMEARRFLRLPKVQKHADWIETIQLLLNLGHLERAAFLIIGMDLVLEDEANEELSKKQERRKARNLRKMERSLETTPTPKVKPPSPPVLKTTSEVDRLRSFLDKSDVLPGEKSELTARIDALSQMEEGKRPFRKEAYDIERSIEEAVKKVRRSKAS